MTFYRWLEPFIEQNGPFAPAACYAHSDFDFPLTSNVHASPSDDCCGYRLVYSFF